MGKNKQWEYETKVEIVKLLQEGRSYYSICKEYKISSAGMIGNWKREYLKGTLSRRKAGRPRQDKENEYEILKKCYAQLMKIRTR